MHSQTCTIHTTDFCSSIRYSLQSEFFASPCPLQYVNHKTRFVKHASGIDTTNSQNFTKYPRRLFGRVLQKKRQKIRDTSNRCHLMCIKDLPIRNGHKSTPFLYQGQWPSGKPGRTFAPNCPLESIIIRIILLIRKIRKIWKFQSSV